MRIPILSNLGADFVLIPLITVMGESSEISGFVSGRDLHDFAVGEISLSVVPIQPSRSFGSSDL